MFPHPEGAFGIDFPIAWEDSDALGFEQVGSISSCFQFGWSQQSIIDRQHRPALRLPQLSAKLDSSFSNDR